VEEPEEEKTQDPADSFVFPGREDKPSLSDKEQKRADKLAQKEARRAEKQAEKEAKRKAKLDGKFKTRSADPKITDDIDMVPEDDD